MALSTFRGCASYQPNEFATLFNNDVAAAFTRYMQELVETRIYCLELVAENTTLGKTIVLDLGIQGKIDMILCMKQQKWAREKLENKNHPPAVLMNSYYKHPASGHRWHAFRSDACMILLNRGVFTPTLCEQWHAISGNFLISPLHQQMECDAIFISAGDVFAQRHFRTYEDRVYPACSMECFEATKRMIDDYTQLHFNEIVMDALRKYGINEFFNHLELMIKHYNGEEITSTTQSQPLIKTIERFTQVMKAIQIAPDGPQFPQIVNAWEKRVREAEGSTRTSSLMDLPPEKRVKINETDPSG